MTAPTPPPVAVQSAPPPATRPPRCRIGLGAILAAVGVYSAIHHDAPAALTVHGQLIATDDSTDAHDSLSAIKPLTGNDGYCTGANGWDDLTVTGDVTITDAAGTVIGTTALGVGQVADTPPVACHARSISAP